MSNPWRPTKPDPPAKRFHSDPSNSNSNSGSSSRRPSNTPPARSKTSAKTRLERDLAYVFGFNGDKEDEEQERQDASQTAFDEDDAREADFADEGHAYGHQEEEQEGDEEEQTSGVALTQQEELDAFDLISKLAGPRADASDKQGNESRYFSKAATNEAKGESASSKAQRSCAIGDEGQAFATETQSQSGGKVDETQGLNYDDDEDELELFLRMKQEEYQEKKHDRPQS